MADLKTEAGVWEYVRPILTKWTRHIELTEEDAYVLLNCFENVDKPDSRPVPLTTAIRREQIAQKHPRSGYSLAILASHLSKRFLVHKDLRTIRRWCEQGIIPCARKTKHGGHWRVMWTAWTPQQERSLMEHIGGHARMPKNLLRSRRWKNFEKRMKPIFSEHIPMLLQLDAELRGDTTEDLQRKRPPKLTDQLLRKFFDLCQRGNRDDMRYLKFRLEARRLFLAGKRLTVAALARRVGISRRTMFRRYHNQATEAIKGAATPLTPDGRPEGISETLHDQVVSHFSDEAEKGTSCKRRIPKTQG